MIAWAVPNSEKSETAARAVERRLSVATIVICTGLVG
jgi:hypothetical protein